MPIVCPNVLVRIFFSPLAPGPGSAPTAEADEPNPPPRWVSKYETNVVTQERNDRTLFASSIINTSVRKKKTCEV